MRKRWSSSAWPPARRSIPMVRRSTCKAFACWKPRPRASASRVSCSPSPTVPKTRPPWRSPFRARSHQNEQVTVELTFTMRLPQRQGRWGQWEGVTFLVQWLPVLAFYDDQGWQPTPFIPWHLPFFNEAGIYTAHITLPLSRSSPAAAPSWARGTSAAAGRRSTSQALGVRDFAVLSSAASRNSPKQVGHSACTAFAFPEDEFYARQMIRNVAEACPSTSGGSAPIPYADFTIAESYFGWNGNQCGGLVMIDERIYRHAAPAPAATSTNSFRTNSATNGGTTSSASTAMPKPGWTRALAAYFGPPLAWTRSTARTTR